ncbi:polymorphic outer membrane protein [Salinisphaera sp. PC39]|uniref:choice-of-anchor Q domain-containing protein n=1 Tax=Salinisphaera sp. PC39 TaxID=1304156 RepID=UPI0033415307
MRNRHEDISHMIVPATSHSRVRPAGGRRLAALLSTLLLAVLSPGAFAATLTVTTLADSDTAETGACTLRAAIADANADSADADGNADTDCPADGAYGDDTIVFDTALYPAIDDGERLELTQREQLVIEDADNALTIDGRIVNPEDSEEDRDVVIEALGNENGNNFVCDTGDDETPRPPIRIFEVRSAATLTDIDMNGGCAPPADPRGGSILLSNNAPLTLDGVNITNSLALNEDTGAGQGGGIFVAAGGTLTMSESSIRASVAGHAGGGLANESTAAITGGCPAAAESDFFSADCTIALDNTSLSGNAAGNDNDEDDIVLGDGGGLHSTAGTVAGRVVTFNSNEATVSGGGIWTSGTVELRSATIQGNNAFALGETGDVAGGAGLFNDGGTLRLTFATVSSNTGITTKEFLRDTGHRGGGLASTGGTVELDTVALSSNRAGQPETESSDGTLPEIPGFGGGIYVDAGDITVVDSTVINNLAQTDGGGIWNAGTPDIQGSDVLNNTARGEDTEDETAVTGGGGLFNSGGGTIADSRFYTNQANGENAGGAAILNTGDLDIADTEIGRNDGFHGAGIDNSGTLTLTRVFLGAPQIESRNIAEGDGGGLRNRSGADATLDDSTVAFNEAADGGGIWNAGTLTIDNSTLSSNDALGGNDRDGLGGALFQSDAGSASLRFSTVADNSANDAGDGIALADGGATVTVESSVVVDAEDGSVSADDNSLINESDPGLDDLKLYGGVLPTHPLAEDSLALDIGDETACGNAPIDNLDQRGATRPFDGDGDETADCDAGSYELTDDPVLRVERNGPDEVAFEQGEDLAVLGFTLSNEGEDSVSVNGFDVRLLLNSGVEALRLLVSNDPDELENLDFDVLLDDDGDGRLDDGEMTQVGSGDGRAFDCTAPQCAIAGGASEDFLIVLRVPEDEENAAALFATPPVLAGGLLVGLLGLVRIRGLRRRAQWLLVVALMTGGLAACSDSSSIDDIEPPAPPAPDPTLQGDLRFELYRLNSPTAGEIVIGDGLPVYGPAIDFL